MIPLRLGLQNPDTHSSTRRQTSTLTTPIRNREAPAKQHFAIGYRLPVPDATLAHHDAEMPPLTLLAGLHDLLQRDTETVLI